MGKRFPHISECQTITLQYNEFIHFFTFVFYNSGNAQRAYCCTTPCNFKISLWVCSSFAPAQNRCACHHIIKQEEKHDEATRLKGSRCNIPKVKWFIRSGPSHLSVSEFMRCFQTLCLAPQLSCLPSLKAKSIKLPHAGKCWNKETMKWNEWKQDWLH